MIYVAIDPSGSFNEGKGHTGIVTIKDSNWESLSITSIYARHYSSRLEYWESILNHLKKFTEPYIVIIESFQIRNNGFSIGTMPETILLIGVIIHYLEQNNIQYCLQTPGSVKSRFKDNLLPKYVSGLECRENKRYYFNGKIINDHVRDAMKHLLYFFKYNLKKFYKGD